jgi:signal transduction histidine kinase
VRLLIIRDVTSGFKYEKLKILAQFADMLTATISHDMRTSLNAIISVSKNIAYDMTRP